MAKRKSKETARDNKKLFTSAVIWGDRYHLKILKAISRRLREVVQNDWSRCSRSNRRIPSHNSRKKTCERHFHEFNGYDMHRYFSQLSVPSFCRSTWPCYLSGIRVIQDRRRSRVHLESWSRRVIYSYVILLSCKCVSVIAESKNSVEMYGKEREREKENYVTEDIQYIGVAYIFCFFFIYIEK